MARATLAVALELMFGHEGGYSNVKTDRGGPTKYGITHKTLAAHRGVKSVSPAEVRAMTIEEATEIYQRSYWSQSGGDLLPTGLDYAAFDFGVNSGPSRAVKSLQTVLKAGGSYGGAIDGHIGERTIDAVNEYPGGIQKLIRDYCDERMRFLRSLGGSQGFAANGRGWTIRVTGKDPKGQLKAQPGVIGNALRLANSHSPLPVETPAEVRAGKADARDTSLTEIVKKPEAWGPLAGLLSTIGAIASGSGPFQYVLAAGAACAIGLGVWYFVRRIRESG